MSDDAKNPDLPRRSFIRLIGKWTVVAGALSVGVETMKHLPTAAASESIISRYPPQGPVPGYNWLDHHWAFAVDATRCIGCLRCVEACKIENDVPFNPYNTRTWVERYVYLDGEKEPHVDSIDDPRDIAAAGTRMNYRFADLYEGQKVDQAFFIPKLCNHCTNPTCVEVCPTGASYQTPDGVVLIDKTYCIGCRYCVQACPYGARYFNEQTNTADKCTWCYHRITKGMKTACVEACPTHARKIGDLKDPNSDVSVFIRENRVQVLKPEMGNQPNVFYVGLNKDVC
ncbi:MAG: 4Fe-4S dicluster domain-containing protein [Betaproteobacteria bacterium]|nr:4Fe-4S dicluster domain-containing protein [Betaproteobacteria bacterium]